MLGTLIESRAARPRRAGGTAVSIGIHAGIIAVATALTAGAAQRRPIRAPATPVVYVSPPAPRPVAPRPPAVPPAVAVPDRLALPDVRKLLTPTSLPRRPGLPAIPIPNWPDARSGPPVYRYPEQWHPAGSGDSHGPVPIDGAWGSDMVDRPVAPRPGNPAPAYPSMLRSANIEGTVDVMFIVDTAGRVEPASIKVMQATHDLFVQAVRRALRESRYEPAEAHGLRVRQIVQQRFTFSLTR